MASQTGDSKSLCLGESTAAELARWARAGYPEERCGVLVGRELAEAIVAHRAIVVANVSAERKHDRYVLDPDGFLRADVEARAAGHEVVGFWHTHPDHPARPSRTDLEAAWEGYVYVIVAVNAAWATELRAWRLHGEEFLEQAIEIELEEVER